VNVKKVRIKYKTLWIGFFEKITISENMMLNVATK
jgi:hypothetical protein